MAQLAFQDALVALLCVLLSVALRWRSCKEDYPSLKVERLLLYPIKGLRPLDVETVELGEKGFKYDRRFVLVSPAEKEGGEQECHLASQFPSHQLLRQSIDSSNLTLTISASDGSSFSTPLQPSTSGLTPQTVTLHSSPTLAYDMGDEAAAFFTKQSEGRATRLMFLDESVSGAKYGNEGRVGREVLGSIGGGQENNGIAFQDCASYMIASSASLADFSRQLGHEMSIMPLRPNIVVGQASGGLGGKLKPWVEDYWAELKIGEVPAIIRLTSNCVRCISLNIDYDTGKRLEGTGLPLQILAKDRRVDKGSYSPVFGRYGFSHDIGKTFSVGDRVQITKLNNERTVFAWPGM
ncbi:hypothetical protein JCM8547_002128 [Rhodosporidiobolus lusitaniae]